MSHRLCSKHSLSPIRPGNNNNNVPSQQQQQPTGLSTSQLKFTSPVKKRILTTPMSQNISTGLSPMMYGLPDLQAQFQMQQAQQAQLQQQNMQAPFQNYVSQEGFAVRAQEVDQNQLRLEIAAREQELKLLAQMDYLIDLIKNIDQDRNVNIDAAKIQEIQQLKTQYQTNIEDELINQSFSQNLGKAEVPKEAGVKSQGGSLQGSQRLQQSSNSKEAGSNLQPKIGGLAASQGAPFQGNFSVNPQERLILSQGGASSAQGVFVKPQEEVQIDASAGKQVLRSSQNLSNAALIEDLTKEIDRLKAQLVKANSDFEAYRSQYNEEANQQISLGFQKQLDEEEVKEQMVGSLSNNLAIASAEKGEQVEKLQEEISQLKAYAGAHEQEAASQQETIEKLLGEIEALEKFKNERISAEEEIAAKTAAQEGIIHSLQSQLEETLLEVQRAIQNAEESRQKVLELEQEKQQSEEQLNEAHQVKEQLQKENEDLKKESESVIIAAENLQKAIEQLQEQKSEDDQQNAEKLDILHAQNEELKNSNVAQAAALEDLEEKVHGAEAEISALQKELEARSSSGAPQEELQKLQVQIEESRARENDANQRAEASEQALKDQSEQIEHLDNESQELKKQFIALEVKNDELQAKNNELQHQLATLNGLRSQELQIKQDAVIHINELQNMLQEKEQENQRLLQENERVEQDRDALNTQLEDLQRALADMEQALTSQAQAAKPDEAHQNDAIKEQIVNLQQSLNESTAMRISANNSLMQSQRQQQEQQLLNSMRSQHSQSIQLQSSQQHQDQQQLQKSVEQITGSQVQQSQHSQLQQSLHESQKQHQQQQPTTDIQELQQSGGSASLQRSQQQRSQALLQKSQQLQQQLLASNKQMVMSQHELASSIHATKMTQSIHGNESLKESQHSHHSGKPLQEQQQQEGEEVLGDDAGCEECESCMLEAALIQNEQLKQQLLIKEKEIIELKTNPAYYARATNYGMPGFPIAPRSPFNQGLGANLIEANDQAVYSRLFESPMQPHFVTTAFTSSPGGQQQQQQQQQQPQQQQAASSSSSQQLSGSKALKGSGVSFSGQKSQAQQFQQQPQQQPQSYSVIQSEIEQLQKIFDSKCKEVESWKKTYIKFSNE